MNKILLTIFVVGLVIFQTNQVVNAAYKPACPNATPNTWIFLYRYNNNNGVVTNGSLEQKANSMNDAAFTHENGVTITFSYNRNNLGFQFFLAKAYLNDPNGSDYYWDFHPFSRRFIRVLGSYQLQQEDFFRIQYKNVPEFINNTYSAIKWLSDPSQPGGNGITYSYYIYCGNGIGGHSYFPGSDDDDDDDSMNDKVILWVDYFRARKGILWGLFGGSPGGCHVVGVKIFDPSRGLPNDFLGYDDFGSELDFGFYLAKDKEGISLDSNTLNTTVLDLSQIPVRFSNANYYAYYFRSSWVNPQCLWNPTSRSTGGMFGGIFDIFRNLLP